MIVIDGEEDLKLRNKIQQLLTTSSRIFFFFCEKEHINGALPRKGCEIKGGSFKIGNNIAIKSLVT